MRESIHDLSEANFNLGPGSGSRVSYGDRRPMFESDSYWSPGQFLRSGLLSGVLPTKFSRPGGMHPLQPVP